MTHNPTEPERPSTPQPGEEASVPRYAFAHLRHELRTPLNQIIGLTDILVEDADERGRPELARDLCQVSSAAHRLLQLINDILDLARIADTPLGIPDAGTAVAAAEVARLPHPHLGPELPGTILVVDDEPTNRDLLRRRLEHLGHTVLTAVDGHGALATLADEEVDLVLLDLLMPGLDGFEVLARMRTEDRFHGVPVIVVSALDDIAGVVRCIEMGAEDYLPKPFNPVLLRARIHASLEKKRLRDREQRLFRELNDSYDRLRGLERLRDDLIQMVVHDLRQPLTSYLAGLRLLDMMGSLQPDQKRCLDIATQGGEMLINMVNDMLDVSRMEEGRVPLETSEVSIQRLFDQARQQMEWLASDKGLSIRCSVPDDIGTVKGDEAKLVRVVANLLGNAVKFTPEGGTITMSASQASDSVCLEVRDTGEGIPAEALDRIFDKFGQVESRKRGQFVSSGLGLTFCRMVAEAHGGCMRVKSAPGQGSTFSVHLPAG